MKALNSWISPLIVPELAIWYRFPQLYTLCYPIPANPIIKFTSKEVMSEITHIKNYPTQRKGIKKKTN